MSFFDQAEWKDDRLEKADPRARAWHGGLAHDNTRADYVETARKAQAAQSMMVGSSASTADGKTVKPTRAASRRDMSHSAHKLHIGGSSSQLSWDVPYSEYSRLKNMTITRASGVSQRIQATQENMRPTAASGNNSTFRGSSARNLGQPIATGNAGNKDVMTNRVGKPDLTTSSDDSDEESYDFFGDKIEAPKHPKPQANVPFYGIAGHSGHRSTRRGENSEKREYKENPSQAYASNASMSKGPKNAPPPPRFTKSNGNGVQDKKNSSQAPRASKNQWDWTSQNEALRPVPGNLTQPQGSKPHEQNLPPHLRAISAASSVISHDDSVSKSSAPAAMNSGKAAKSAKHDSKFPCTYEECARGFANEKAMKDHKDEVHDWCRLCKQDFEDDDKLLQHKITSEKHICCIFCGEDFRSEAGRDHHQRQNHAAAQEVKCVGCGTIFTKGSGLIDHIYRGRCSNKGGSQPGNINQMTLRTSRAAAALELHAISNRPSTTSQEIAAMQPPSVGSVAGDESSVGGVPLPNFIDNDFPEIGDQDDSKTVAASRSVTPTQGTTTPAWPSYKEITDENKQKGKNIIEGLEDLRLKSSHGNTPSEVSNSVKTTGWTKALFPDAKPTPANGRWKAPSQAGRQSSGLPSDTGSSQVRTDWDFMGLLQDPVDAEFHCPFIPCTFKGPTLQHLKDHLTSGYHQGTSNRCVQCLKIFKTPAALVAHLESNTTRCAVKDTEEYGHFLHVTSGGFLVVTGRHGDGTLKIEANEADESVRHKLMIDPDDLDGRYY